MSASVQIEMTRLVGRGNSIVRRKHPSLAFTSFALKPEPPCLTHPLRISGRCSLLASDHLHSNLSEQFRFPWPQVYRN